MKPAKLKQLKEIFLADNQITGLATFIKELIDCGNITNIPNLYERAYNAFEQELFQKLMLTTFQLFCGYEMKNYVIEPIPIEPEPWPATPKFITYSPNPALDLCFDFSKINQPNSYTIEAGGKGINISCGLTDWGMEPVTLGTIGGYTGTIFCQLLQAKNIDTSNLIQIEADTRINLSAHTGNNDLLHFTTPGTKITVTEQEQLAKKITTMINPGDTLILAGSLPGSLPPDHYATLIKGCHNRDCTTILDTSGKALQTAIHEKPTLLGINTKELGELLGINHLDFNSNPTLLASITKNLIKSGIKKIYISMGRSGIVMTNEHGSWHSAPPVLKELSSVGAGDIIKTAISYGMRNKLNDIETLKLATAASALTVTKAGSGLAGLTESKEFMSTIVITSVG